MSRSFAITALAASLIAANCACAQTTPGGTPPGTAGSAGNAGNAVPGDAESGLAIQSEFAASLAISRGGWCGTSRSPRSVSILHPPAGELAGGLHLSALRGRYHQFYHRADLRMTQSSEGRHE
jgi:hypothetical protein